MDRMRDCLQAKHSVHERYDFESAKHEEIVYHVKEWDERDCLQAKHSVHERSE